jgi:hypothetical protein
MWSAELVTLIFTDGYSDDDVYGPSTNLKSDHVVIFCIGLGNVLSQSELDFMASDPDNEHVFTLGGYEELNPEEFVKFLDAATCEG